jgi:hypothetical protein
MSRVDFQIWFLLLLPSCGETCNFSSCRLNLRCSSRWDDGSRCIVIFFITFTFAPLYFSDVWQCRIKLYPPFPIAKTHIPFACERPFLLLVSFNRPCSFLEDRRRFADRFWNFSVAHEAVIVNFRGPFASIVQAGFPFLEIFQANHPAFVGFD